MAPIGVSDLYPAVFIVYPLCILSLLLPAPVHFKSGNTGVILFITYALISHIILLTNAIIWKGNVGNPVPYWCDLTSFLLAIIPTGISCATLCITRQLHGLSKAQAVIISAAQKRKQLFIDLFVGVVIPLLVGGGHAIIQGHRYDVYEDFGCLPTTYNVTLAYPLFFIWPLFFSLVSAIFGLLALRQFLQQRKNFEMLLSSTNSGMQKNRYIRLMWLCCADLICAIPYHIFVLLNASVNSVVSPWVSWEETQFDWYRVDFYRRVIIDMVPYIRVACFGYVVINVAVAVVWFMFFGMTREAIKSYVNAYYWCLKPFGVKRPVRAHVVNAPPKRSWLDKLLGRDAIPLNSAANTTASLPTFVQHPTSKSIPSARPRATPTHSATDTLNWEDDLPKSPASVLVVDGRRLTIPGLNGMHSFDSEEYYDEKSRRTGTPSSSSSHDTYHNHSHAV